LCQNSYSEPSSSGIFSLPVRMKAVLSFSFLLFLFTFLFPSKFFLPYSFCFLSLFSSFLSAANVRGALAGESGVSCSVLLLHHFATLLFYSNKQVLKSAPFCSQIVNFRLQIIDVSRIMAHCSTGNGAIKLQRMKSYTLFDTSCHCKFV